MKKILIVGSKGFIGRHCFEYFTSRGYETWGCDVVSEYDGINYLFIDAGDSDFHSIFHGRNFDVCINCSGAANVPFSMDRPLHDFSLNTLNVFKLLEAIRLESPHCRFINLSSAAVYGNPTEIPVKETAAITPVSPYGCHKAMAEQICREFHRYWGIATCSMRIFSAYGPGLRKQLLWDIYSKSRTEEEIVLFGTGNESRDFIYIDDVVRLIERTMLNASFQGEAINCANGVQVSVRSIVTKMLDALGCNKPVVFKGCNRPGDPLYWEADIDMAHRIGYKQSVSLEEGIKTTAKWYKENA